MVFPTLLHSLFIILRILSVCGFFDCILVICEKENIFMHFGPVHFIYVVNVFFNSTILSMTVPFDIRYPYMCMTVHGVFISTILLLKKNHILLFRARIIAF